jgi:hypothetical protein
VIFMVSYPICVPIREHTSSHAARYITESILYAKHKQLFEVVVLPSVNAL